MKFLFSRCGLFNGVGWGGGRGNHNYNFLRQGYLLGDTVNNALANDKTLDLGSTLVDLEDLGVTVQLLDRVLCVETSTAKDLDGIASRLDSDIRGKSLGDRSLPGVAVAVILEPTSLPDHGAGSLNTNGHIGDHELDSLVVDDGLAHSLTVDSVLGSLNHGAASQTNGTGSDQGTGDIEGTHGDLESLTNSSQTKTWKKQERKRCARIMR